LAKDKSDFKDSNLSEEEKEKEKENLQAFITFNNNNKSKDKDLIDLNFKDIDIEVNIPYISPYIYIIIANNVKRKRLCGRCTQRVTLDLALDFSKCL
jgi:hypothetical protein